MTCLLKTPNTAHYPSAVITAQVGSWDCECENLWALSSPSLLLPKPSLNICMVRFLLYFKELLAFPSFLIKRNHLASWLNLFGEVTCVYQIWCVFWDINYCVDSLRAFCAGKLYPTFRRGIELMASMVQQRNFLW